MKFSDFKVNKKIIFEQEDVIIRNGEDMAGEIIFYELDFDKLVEINEKVIQHLVDENDEKILFMLIPYLTNVEMDVKYEEFHNMVKIPTTKLMIFIDEIVNSIDELYDRGNKLVDFYKKNEEVNKKMQSIKF